MISKVLKTINDFNMLDNTKGVILGVSGGIDSISLLHFFIQNVNVSIKVAHVNHNLRGNESLRDEKFVKQICESWNVEFILGSFDVLNFSKNNKKGIEESAREIRYKFFEDLSFKYNSKIVTAHNLSDNLETILFNFTRGSGLSGLCGIPPVRNNIIRPFIYVTRQEIEMYAKKNKLNYVLDSSNLSDIYCRNKIRHSVIPKLKEINGSFEKSASRCVWQIREENEFLDSIAEETFKKTGFEYKKIKLLTHVIRNRVLKLILKKNDIDVNYKYINFLNLLIDEKINSFCVSNLKRVEIKDEKIICKTLNTVKIKEKKAFITKIKRDEIKKSDDLNNFFAFNGNLSDFEFRTRKPGDIFQFPRRNCSKSLKKLFNELKIPIEERASLKILENKSHGDIVWIESVGVSKKYQVSCDSIFIGKITIL